MSRQGDTSVRSLGASLELFEMNDVARQLLGGEVVEQAKHAPQEQAVLPTAQLTGHDNPGM